MTDTLRQHPHILAAIQSELWAITPQGLQQILAIADGYGDLSAVEAKLGRPLPNTRTVTQRGPVALIPVSGPIFRYANVFTQVSGATSVEMLALDLQTALENPDISHIVQVFDSPGGMVAGISEYARMVREASAIKPVISYVSASAASAALWIAAAASSVVINDTAGMGSLGVVLQGRKNSDTGAWEIVSSQSPLKRADPQTPEGRAALQSQVDAIAQVFVQAMAEYRGVTVDHALASFGQGGMLVGQAAVDAGLADRLGSLESLITELSAGQPAIHRKPNGASMSAETKPTAALTVAQIKADHPDVYEAIRAEGFAAGRTEGAETERARIKAVHSTPLAQAHQALITGMMFDGKTTGPEAAVAILDEESKGRADFRSAVIAEAIKPAPHAETPQSTASSADNRPLEERARAKWESDPAIRAEFGEYSTFEAYLKAAETGAVRILGTA